MQNFVMFAQKLAIWKAGFVIHGQTSNPNSGTSIVLRRKTGMTI